jgi:transposase
MSIESDSVNQENEVQEGESIREILPVAPGGAREEPLIDESVFGAIRALREQGHSRKAIARELGLDIKTVRKWLSRSWTAQVRPGRSRSVAPYEAFLRARAPEVGWNGSVLYREVVAQGFTGSYPTVSRALRPWRAEVLQDSRSTVRFETEPGEQAQVDWGTARVWLGEQRLPVHFFVMVLGFSRRVYVRGYLGEGLEPLLDGHARAFEHFGGRTETILYDNPRTIVQAKDETAGTVVCNATFKDRMDFYGVTIRLCRYYRARTKGKVESGVKYVKRNGLAGRRFADLDALNAALLVWCAEVADQRVHGTTHEIPAERFARAEQAALIAVDARPPAPRELIRVQQVPSDGLVPVLANRYPVPLAWAGLAVRVHIRAEEIVLVRDGDEPLVYERLLAKYQVARWKGPARRAPAPGSRSAEAPPRWDPAYLERLGEVEVRSLGRYESLASEVSP